MDRFHGTLTLSCREICEYSSHNTDNIDSADCDAHNDEQSEPSLFIREQDVVSEFDPFSSQHRSPGTVTCCTNDSLRMSSSSSSGDLIDFHALAESAPDRRSEAPFEQMFREVEDRMHRLFERYAQLKSDRVNRVKSAEDCEALKSVSTNNLPLTDHVDGEGILQTRSGDKIADSECSPRSEYSTSSYGAFPSPKSYDRLKTVDSVAGSDSVWNENENVTSDRNHLHDLFRTTLRLGKESELESKRITGLGKLESPVHSSAASAETSRNGIPKTLCECGKVCSCCSLTGESSGSSRPEARDVATSPIAVRSARIPEPEKLSCHFDNIGNMQHGEHVAGESLENEAERCYDSDNNRSLGNDTRVKIQDCALNDATLSRSADEYDADQCGYAGPFLFPPSPISLQTAFRCHKQSFVQRCQERQMQIRKRHPKRETSDTRSDGLDTSSGVSIKMTNRGRTCKTRLSNTKSNQRLLPNIPYQPKTLWTSSNMISLKTAKEETERRYNAIVKRSKLQPHPENRKREFQSRRIRQMVYAKTIRNRNFYLYGQKECRCTCGFAARS